MVLGASCVAALLAAWVAWGPPRLLIHNVGVRVDYPLVQVIAAFGAAILMAVAAGSVRRNVARVGLAAVATFALGPALFLSRYELDVGAAGLRQRVFLAEQTIPWENVRHVEPQEAGIVVRPSAGPPMWIDTVGMRPADRAVLDRTIARRLTEGFTSPVATAR